MLLAIALGVLLLGAGVLLFVAANWDQLSPGRRFGLVLGMVAAFHLGGAATAHRFTALAMGFHAAGSVALGAGIFLSGQIFHLQEHWPGGLMLWALGAGAALVLRRDWPHVALVALLVPAWLSGEWVEFMSARSGITLSGVVAVGWLLLALTYLSAAGAGPVTPARRTLVWIGGIAVIPATAVVVLAGEGWPFPGPGVSAWTAIIAALLGLGLPLALALGLRGRRAAVLGWAAAWAVALSAAAAADGEIARLLVHGLCGVGALGLIAWGLREARAERINLGVAGFALTVIAFYFAEVMDKLDRSVSLIGLGVLFLAGGWFLERTRRRLLARVPDRSTGP